MGGDEEEEQVYIWNLGKMDESSNKERGVKVHIKKRIEREATYQRMWRGEEKFGCGGQGRGVGGQGRGVGVREGVWGVREGMWGSGKGFEYEGTNKTKQKRLSM